MEIRTQSDLRAYNESRILDYIREHPGSTQADVGSALKLTRAAVAKLFGGEARPGEEENLRRVLSAAGSRPARFSLRADAGCVVSVDIGSRHVRVRVADLLGATKASVKPERTIGAVREPHLVLEETAALFDAALGEAGYSRAQVAGAAISVPFPINRTSIVTETEWRNVQLPAALWRLLDWSTQSVLVESDATLGAVAELEAALGPQGIPGLRRDATSLLYVKWSTAITAAVVSEGRPQRGQHGMAGSFAHTPVALEPIDGDAVPCRVCGRQCLDAVASLEAMVRRLALSGDFAELSAESRATELVRRARGDVDVQRVIHRAAEAVGRALGAAANVVDPSLVVVGGAFHSADYAQLERSVLAGFEEYAFPPLVGVRPAIQSGWRTGGAAVGGGIALALHRFAVPFLLRLARGI